METKLMSNSVYGYIVTANKSVLLDEIWKIVSSQPLGFIVDSPEHLYNFPPLLVPQSDNVLVFSICDSKTTNIAEDLLDSLDYVADLNSGLPREANDRRRLLVDLVTMIFEMKQVDKLYLALTEVNEIEAVVTISLPDFANATMNNYEGPPCILYIIEKN